MFSRTEAETATQEPPRGTVERRRDKYSYTTPNKVGSMGSVSYRQAEDADAEAMWWTKHAAIDGIETGVYTEEQLRAWKPDGEAVEDFKRAIESDTFDAVVAEADGEVVGYAVLNIAEARIDAVFVNPEFVRQGIATSLVRQLETRARMRGIPALTIVSSLNATPFYEVLGYEKRDDKTRTIDGEELEFVVVEKRLE